MHIKVEPTTWLEITHVSKSALFAKEFASGRL